MATNSKKNDVWGSVTSHFSSLLDQEDYDTWFSRASLKTLHNDLVVIEVPNKFFEKWFKEKYLKELHNFFKNTLDSSPNIKFEIKYGNQEINNKNNNLINRIRTIKNYFDQKLTFNKFIIANSNAFAYYACLEIVNNTTNNINYKYNPLYIFSDKSNGKTHLLNAIGNKISYINNNISIFYTNANQFTQNFSQALNSGRIQEFRNSITCLDLLLFDDVHLLEGRVKSQEEFIFLFDSLLRQGKTVVVSGNKVPFRLEETNPRLRSLLGWGLLAEINPPEPETRVEILKQKTVSEGFPLPEDIIFFLAKSNDDMKELFRNMTRLQTFASLNGGGISLSDVRALIRDRKETDIHDIQSIAAGYFRISVSELKSDKRQRAFSYPRQVAMYLCRKFTKNSYKKIGAAFGNKDHSTVIHAVRRIDKELAGDPVIREDLKNLENLIS